MPPPPPPSTSIHFAACGGARAGRRPAAAAAWGDFERALRARGVDVDAPRVARLARRAHADMTGADGARALEEALAYVVAATVRPPPRAAPAALRQLEEGARAGGAADEVADALGRRID